MFLRYCENSKSFRIYISIQMRIEFSKDVTFYEDVSLGKSINLPPPPKKDDDMDILKGTSMQ